MDIRLKSSSQVVPPEANRLSEALASLSLTQKAAAEKLHFNEKYLSQVKTGKKPLTSSLTFRLEHVFGVSSRWLLHGEGQMISDPSKAAVYLKPERLPELAFYHRDTASAEWNRMAPFEQNLTHFVPLLAHPAGPQTDLDEESAGRYVRTPLLVPPGEFYSLRAGSNYRCLFRPDEFLLIETLADRELQPGQITNRVCVLRKAEGGSWGLAHVEVLTQQQVKAEITVAVSSDEGETETMLWGQLDIAGIVVMAFRTHFRKPESG